MYTPAVTAFCINSEGGMLADWIRIMIVVTFPGIIVVMENEVSSKKEHFRTYFTALAHPFPM